SFQQAHLLQQAPSLILQSRKLLLELRAVPVELQEAFVLFAGPPAGQELANCAKPIGNAHALTAAGVAEEDRSGRSAEAVSALDAVVEPLIEQDVAQPPLAQVARQLRADRIEQRMPAPARAGLHLREPRVVIDADQEVGIGQHAGLFLEEVGQAQRRRVTTALVDRKMQGTIARNA